MHPPPLMLAEKWAWYFSMCSSIFSRILFSLSALLSFKRGSQMPHQQGLPFIICSIHCSPFFAFIRLTINREWWRHYAIGCNTITSLSHFSVAAKAGTVSSSSVLRQIQLYPQTRGKRETHCDFLPLPGNQKSHSGCLATTNYFMPLGSACAGRDHGRALEKNEDD